ncbi:hypothetical protein V1290_005455 [Bradyrhizobium sp. AZCC 1578]
MTPHIPEEISTSLIDWSPFVLVGNSMPPRDPKEDEEDRADEPPVVRKPDETSAHPAKRPKRRLVARVHLARKTGAVSSPTRQQTMRLVSIARMPPFRLGGDPWLHIRNRRCWPLIG